MSTKELDPEFQTHVVEALSEVAVGDFGEVTADRELVDLGLDSISVAEMIIILEDKVDVSIEMEELQELVTFGDLQALVVKLREQPPEH